ncbi:hypothetical protein HNR03_001869 [Pseudomonas sp. JAI111]|nr:hypothetical protein [Pseudomonas sp. JAI111]
MQFNAIVRDRHVVVRVWDFLILSLVCPRVRLAKLSPLAKTVVLTPETVKAASSFLSEPLGISSCAISFWTLVKLTHTTLNAL